MKWQNQAVFPLLIINASGTFSGLFVYAPIIGAGNLVASTGAQAGTDPYGNAYLAGVVSYGQTGGTFFAVALASPAGIPGSVVFYSAPAAGGPWTRRSNIEGDAVGNINMDPAIGQIVNIAGGLAVGDLAVSSATGVVAVSATGSGLFKVTETGGAPAAPPTQLIAHTAGDRALGIEVTGDAAFRMRVDSNGRHDYGDGTVTDVATLRAAAGVYAITSNVVVGAAAETTTAALEIQGGAIGIATHAAPGTPPAGFGFAYVNSTDLFPHYKAASGSDLTIPGSSGDNTSITVTAAAATRITRNWNIAAGDVSAAGTTYRLTAWGNGTEGSTAQNLTWSIWLNGAAAQSVTAAALTVNGTFRWQVTILLTVATTGAAGNGSLNLGGEWSTTASPTVANSFSCGSASATGQAFNTTALNTLALAVAWASVTGAPTITCIGSTFERIGP